MGDTETDAPSRTDTGWFDDSDDLTAFSDDPRLFDTRMASTFDDAQAIIAAFASNDGGGAWASLDRAEVAGRLATLIAPAGSTDSGEGYRSLAQGGLNLCGPAALLVMAMGRDPVAVARYATELFETGTGSIGNFTVTASEELRGADFAALSTRGTIASQAEWMMLSAIRNATEPFWQPEWVGDPDQELAGMTRPEELAAWLRETGIWREIVDNGRWASNPGIPDITSILPIEGSDWAILLHTNLIKESTVKGSDAAPRDHAWSIDQYFPNHWVLLVSEATSQLADNAVELTIWTWGGRLRLHVPQQVLIDNYFGTVCARM